MAELSNSLRGRAPPPVAGNDSEDSEDDFRPLPPGKGDSEILIRLVISWQEEILSRRKNLGFTGRT